MWSDGGVTTSDEPGPPPTMTELGSASQALRTPKAAALAGIAFAVLLITALVIIRVAVTPDARRPGPWLDDDSSRGAVVFALNLVPFAGIAFLWFIGAVRDHVGTAEDRFFATVFLGSGLLFIAMLFAGAAMAAGLTTRYDPATASADANAWQISRQTMNTVITVYAMRMAAVFVISTTSIMSRLRLIPRWLTMYGFASAGVLLATVGTFAWVELLFPFWVLVLSVHLLRTRFRVEPLPATT